MPVLWRQDAKGGGRGGGGGGESDCGQQHQAADGMEAHRGLAMEAHCDSITGPNNRAISQGTMKKRSRVDAMPAAF